MFEAFDLPESTFSCARRDVTNVAPQALALLNNEFIFQQAAELAARLVAESGNSPQAWVENGWRLALGRSPSASEKQKALGHFFGTEPGSASPNGASGKSGPPKALTEFCLMLFNLNEFIYID
jgi:hypothetical protein